MLTLTRDTLILQEPSQPQHQAPLLHPDTCPRDPYLQMPALTTPPIISPLSYELMKTERVALLASQLSTPFCPDSAQHTPRWDKCKQTALCLVSPQSSFPGLGLCEKCFGNERELRAHKGPQCYSLDTSGKGAKKPSLL